MIAFWLNYILICIIFYLIGSIPFAYLIVKRRFNINILNEGTGNSGAMNSYDVTKSKKTGVIVFLLDFLKGFIPSILLLYVFKLPMKYSFIPLVLLVFGHNFSVWLKFKGGRGLSTSAGIYFSVNFVFVIIWLILYFVSYIVKKNIHLANSIATLLLPLFPIVLQDNILKFNYNYIPTIEYKEFFILFSCLISLMILIKHIEPLVLFFKKIK